MDQQTSTYRCISNDISVSELTCVTLREYITLLPYYCKNRHCSTCAECPGLLLVANSILSDGYVKLSTAFHSAFPDVTYHAINAKRKLLKMPIAALRVGNTASGTSCVYLFEHSESVNYHQLLQLLNHYHEKDSSSSVSITKADIRDILSLTTSDEERELIRYGVWKASGLSATGAARHMVSKYRMIALMMRC